MGVWTQQEPTLDPPLYTYGS